jgi:hypothetical protein
MSPISEEMNSEEQVAYSKEITHNFFLSKSDASTLGP